jgi:thymidine kinase
MGTNYFHKLFISTALIFMQFSIEAMDIKNKFDIETLKSLKCTLILLIGPMFSGKTTLLIDAIRIIEKWGLPVKAFNHSLDKTRGGENKIQSHNEDSCNAISIDNTNLNLVKQSPADYILIDEAQFFKSELLIPILSELKKNKVVIVSALDMDFLCARYGFSKKPIRSYSKHC